MFCKKCDSSLLVSSDKLKLLFSFTVSQDGIVLGTGELINTLKRSAIVEPDYYCPECGKISVDNIYAICDYCGNKFSLNEIYKFGNESCCYCLNCSSKELKLDMSRKILLFDICKNLLIKKGDS